jgi:hypothetical protein
VKLDVNDAGKLISEGGKDDRCFFSWEISFLFFFGPTITWLNFLYIDVFDTYIVTRACTS